MKTKHVERNSISEEPMQVSRYCDGRYFMDRQIIISIGRECGSGGRLIAEIIGQELGIDVLDKNMLHSIHEETDIDMKSLEKYDESSRSVGKILGVSKGNEITLLIWDYIKEKADRGESFVVVGRCSEYVLKDNPNLLSVFISGDKYDKHFRMINDYGIPESEAEELRIRTDDERQKFHDRNSESKWGEPGGYDIHVNSSSFGIPGAADVIIKAAERKAESSSYDKDEILKRIVEKADI